MPIWATLFVLVVLLIRSQVADLLDQVLCVRAVAELLDLIHQAFCVRTVAEVLEAFIARPGGLRVANRFADNA